MIIIYTPKLNFDGKQCRVCGAKATARVKAGDYSAYWYYCTNCKNDATMEE